MGARLSIARKRRRPGAELGLAVADVKAPIDQAAFLAAGPPLPTALALCLEGLAAHHASKPARRRRVGRQIVREAMIGRSPPSGPIFLPAFLAASCLRPAAPLGLELPVANSTVENDCHRPYPPSGIIPASIFLLFDPPD